MAKIVKTSGLGRLGAMQANIPMRHDIFFHHISQAVCGRLALFGQAVQAFGQDLNDQGDRRKQKTDDQRELPVQVNQVADERQQRQHVPRQPHDRIDQR